MATAEVIFKIRTDSADFKSTMAQVRSELTKTGQTQSTLSKGELSSRQQLAAAASLQRQRSAALISEWKKAEAGGKSLKDVMDGLSRSISTMQGPLGGIAGRFSSIGSLFTELTSSGAGLAVGIGAIVAVAAGAAVAIFKLTTQTAEFQGKMFDLSQQVGVSVETLSTLEVVAQTSGANIEAITQSIFIFQQKLEDAQDPTSKQAKLLKELGVETNNTEQAFRQALAALAKMPEGFQQSDTAAQLFGSRGGKQVLGVLKEMNGDLDGTTEKFRKMGFLITTEAAKAADKFNDQLAVLGFQLRALTGIIGNEAMPEISAAIGQVSKLLTENQGIIREWTSAIGDAARGAIVVADAIIAISNAVTGLNNVPIPLILRLLLAPTGIEGIARGLASLGAQGPFAGVTGGAGPAKSGAGLRRTGGGGRKGKSARDTSLRDATKEAALAEQEAQRLIEADITENNRALEEQVRSIEDFTKRAIDLDQQKLDATIDRITAESNALDEALAKNLIKQAEYENKQRELDDHAGDAHKKRKDNEFKLERERDLEVSQVRIAALRREVEIAEAADQREIERTQNKVDQGVLTEAEGERRIAAILDQGFERRKKLLEEESDAYSTSLERRKDITAELIRLDGERVASAEDAARRIFEAGNEKARGATRPREVFGAPDDPFNELGRVAQESLGLAAEHAQTFGNIISTTFGQIGEAVGSAVKAFVLFGTAQGSFKKFAAEVIASVAQMSAVQAIFELAQGLAMLALNFFFPNPKYAASAVAHFKAAAIFGGIALVTAGVGRAVAGNSFNEGSGSGGSGAGERTGGPETRPPDVQPRDINRQGSTVPTINLQVHVTRDEGSTVKAFVNDYRSNGVVRNLILNGG